MSELTDKVSAMGKVLAAHTTFDRFLMDRAFATLSGLDIGRLEPKVRRKLDRVMFGFNQLAQVYPEAADPTKPLPATALVAYAYHMQLIRHLAWAEEAPH